MSRFPSAWQAGIDGSKEDRRSERADAHVHKWPDWKEIGRTGDWFHPLIVERKCKTCGATETDEH